MTHYDNLVFFLETPSIKRRKKKRGKFNVLDKEAKRYAALFCILLKGGGKFAI